MAERLKQKILEREKLVDIVCGPDAYRDLPRLLALTSGDQAAGTVTSHGTWLFVQQLVQANNKETSTSLAFVRESHQSPMDSPQNQQ